MREVGIDIVELNRLDKPRAGFVNHVLSKEEIEIYNSYNEIRKKEFLGGRFAAKEAIIKCLSQIEMPNMNEIVILNNKSGKPIAKYKDYNLKISISHEKEYAIAIAILE